MSQPVVSASAQRVSDEISVMVRDSSVRDDSASDTRASTAGEWLYRRLSDREFEGSQTLSGDAGIEMTLQYRSVFLQRDCAGTPPTPVSRFGEP
jgi:hypothetical protein